MGHAALQGALAGLLGVTPCIYHIWPMMAPSWALLAIIELFIYIAYCNRCSDWCYQTLQQVSANMMLTLAFL